MSVEQIWGIILTVGSLTVSLTGYYSLISKIDKIRLEKEKLKLENAKIELEKVKLALEIEKIKEEKGLWGQLEQEVSTSSSIIDQIGPMECPIDWNPLENLKSSSSGSSTNQGNLKIFSRLYNFIFWKIIYKILPILETIFTKKHVFLSIILSISTGLIILLILGF